MDTSMNNTERNISYSVASRRRLVYSSSKIPYRTKTVCHTRFASFFNPTVPFLVFCLTQCARLKGRSEKNKERLEESLRFNTYSDPKHQHLFLRIHRRDKFIRIMMAHTKTALLRSIF
jgi:hypothetical protein